MSVSGTRSGGPELTAEDFEAIESAVLETRKGRWFLSEFAKRHRSADTVMLLDMMKKLENALVAKGGTPGDAEFAALAACISATRSDIAAVRNDMIPGGSVLENTPEIYGQISNAASAAAGELMSRSQSLQAVAQSLKAKAANEAPVVDQESGGLQTLAWQQDVVSQRLAKAMGLLAHLDDRITQLALPITGGVADLAQQLTPANLNFFKQDEELFAAPPPATDPAPDMQGPRVVIFGQKTEALAPEHSAPAALPEPVMAALPAQAPVAEPKRRVVIIRRPPPDQMSIPLAAESASSAM